MSIIMSSENISDENLMEYIKLMEIKTEKITELDISNNNISDINLICNLFPNLKSLNISNNKIVDINSITKLKNILNKLIISYNKIEDISIFKYMKKIIYLDLSNNNFKIENDKDVDIISIICHNIYNAVTYSTRIEKLFSKTLILKNIKYDINILHEIENGDGSFTNDVDIVVSLIYKLHQEYPTHQLFVDYSIEEIKNNKELFDIIILNVMEIILEKATNKNIIINELDWNYCFNNQYNKFDNNIIFDI